MSTQFNDYTPVLNSEWEKVIAEINKILSARLAYNKELNKFYREASVQEFEQFYRATTVNFKSSKLTDKDIENDKETISAKDYMVRYTSDYIVFYENIEKIISKKPYTQKVIDELHFLFNKEYIAKGEVEKYEILKKQFQTSLHERGFLRAALNELEPIVSEIEENYKNDYVFTFLPVSQTQIKMFFDPVDRKSHLTRKFDSFFVECSTICLFLNTEWCDTHGGDESFRIIFMLFEKAMDILKEHRNRLNEAVAKGPENIDNIWHVYHEAYEQYLDLLKIKPLFSPHPFLSPKNKSSIQETPPETTQSKASKKNQKRRQKLKGAKIASNIGEAADLEPSKSLEMQQKSMIQVDIEENKNKSEYVVLSELQAQEWKRKVEQLQIEQQNAILKKRMEENLRSEEQKKTQEELFLEKEKQYKNACLLLGLLNKTNLELVESMFEKPTPHCTIRYQQVESLFGKEAGKLLGAITSVSGSHRKITIHNTIGFFDEFSQVEANLNKKPVSTHSPEIVGGMYKPHKSGQGNSTLPSVAIRMVCSTLEKAGITATNIARFYNEQKNGFKASHS